MRSLQAWRQQEQKGQLEMLRTHARIGKRPSETAVRVSGFGRKTCGPVGLGEPGELAFQAWAGAWWMKLWMHCSTRPRLWKLRWLMRLWVKIWHPTWHQKANCGGWGGVGLSWFFLRLRWPERRETTHRPFFALHNESKTTCVTPVQPRARPLC